MDDLVEATENLTLHRSRRRISYTNLLTEEKRWLEKKCDEKKLSAKVEAITSFFQPTSTNQISWLPLDNILGNVKAFFGRIQGAVPMGLVKLEPNGYFRLHWHNGKKKDEL